MISTRVFVPRPLRSAPYFPSPFRILDCWRSLKYGTRQKIWLAIVLMRVAGGQRAHFSLNLFTLETNTFGYVHLTLVFICVNWAELTPFAVPSLATALMWFHLFACDISIPNVPNSRNSPL